MNMNDLRTVQQDEAARYLDRKKLARRWNVSVRSIFNYARRGLIKPLCIGRSVRYAIADIEAIESRHGVQSAH